MNSYLKMNLSVCGVLLAAVLGVTERASAQPFAYVANSDSISVIDTATNSVVTTIPISGSPSGIPGVAITPDGQMLVGEPARRQRVWPLHRMGPESM